MSDIVERLREEIKCWPDDQMQLLTEAADEIERLRTESELLHAELRVTKELGLAALRDAMQQARIG